MVGVVVDMKMKSDDKNKALEAAIGQIEKAFGKGSVMKLGQRESAVDVQAISTGSLGLDIGLGIGGFPKGRIVEVYGPESSGKTTLALHAVAEAQKEGGTCAFVDAEHALDPVYARKLGVNIDDLLISQPDAGEQALEIADTLVRSGAIDVLVVDSVAALVPRAELEGEMGDHHVGLHARLMSQALRKLTSSIARSNCLVIFINQIRLKIGVMFGNPETTTGGNALKFYASVRLDIRRIGAIKDRDEVVGTKPVLKLLKTRWRPHSVPLNSTLCMARVFQRWANCSTSGWQLALSINQVRGFPTMGSVSGRDAKTQKHFCGKTWKLLMKSKP